MYICFICLKNMQQLQTVHLNKAEDCTVKQIKYVLPEIILESKIPAYICSSCHTELNSFYTFKKLCLENYCRLKHFIEQGTNDTQDQLYRTLQINNKDNQLDVHFTSESSEEGINQINNFINIENIDIKEDREFECNEEPNMYQQLLTNIKYESDSDQDNSNEMKNDDTIINTTGNLIPEKSRDIYENCYSQFMDWRQKKNINSFSEDDVLVYFSEISTKWKPSTLWTIYSMLRTTIGVKHNINIANYDKLRAFLKRKSSGYQAKKSKTLTREEMKKFINEAPDDIYLATKVASIVAIMGACRKYELREMKIENIEDLGSEVLIRVPGTKSKIERTFKLTGDFCTIFKKYVALRPQNVSTNYFFLNYQKGRCIKQVIGKNKFGDMPKQIARFLQLQNPELYTGHCFRRSSATILVGADALRRHSRWKPTKVEIL